jgi:hypothetical protein
MIGLIYEHWRLDTNECFYVGQARGQNPYVRANTLDRAYNTHYTNVVRKLAPLGLIQIRISEFPGITRSALNNLEKLCIAHQRMYIGSRLTNKTAGGDGGNTYEYKTAEEVARLVAKRLATVDAQPAEQKEKTRQNRSKGMKLAHENMLEEVAVARISKMKATKAAQSAEKKAEIQAKRKATIAAKTPAQKAAIEAKRQATLAARTPEQLAAQEANRKAKRAARAPEQIAATNLKISKGVKIAHTNKSPEKEAARIAKQKATKASRPPTAKQLADREDRKTLERREHLRKTSTAAAERRTKEEWDDITSRANATKAARRLEKKLKLAALVAAEDTEK